MASELGADPNSDVYKAAWGNGHDATYLGAFGEYAAEDGELPLGCSFAPETPVLMADGDSKPIHDIKAGDRVEAADPATGQHQGSRTVEHTWINHDTDLVDVVITNGSNRPATLHTTTNHPFWDATLQSWVPAGELVPGHSLATSIADHAQVAGVIATPGTADRYNLTVSQLHTYYALAGATPVLVHNSCGPIANNKPGDLALEMMEADFAGVTPMTAGTPEFAKATSSGGRFLWAVGEDGALHIIPDAPGLHHTVMTGGNSVIGAGQVTITSRGVVSSIDNMTGHYTPCPECAAQFLQQGVSAFERAGIRVPLSAIKDYKGKAP